MNDIVIRNGLVIDPENQVCEIRDVAMEDGILVAPSGSARYEVDASGCIVTPGLIDMHIHVAPLMHTGVPAEACCYPNGVTYAADGGSSGWMNWKQFLAPIAGMGIGLKSFINVNAVGLNALGSYPEDINPQYWNRKEMIRLVKEYPDKIAGFKIRIGEETLRDLGINPLLEAVRLAREAGTRLMVHPTRTPIPMREILDALGEGDILTHAFHGHGETLLGEGGMDAARRAKERGVVLDIADGGWHFSYAVYKAARENGIFADTCSTDLTTNGWNTRPASGFCMAYCMSRQWILGVPMREIIAMVTSRPAKILGIQAGTLTLGRTADIAVLRTVRKTMSYMDGVGERVTGEEYIRPMMTIRRGKIVYRDMEI